MARRRFAPTHTLTGTPRYVPASDTAWREDQLPRADEKDHPYWSYYSGRTRFDLDDPELVEMIDLAAKPEIWTMRPLKTGEKKRVALLQRLNQDEEACEYAFVHGVESVDNVDEAFGKKLRELLAAKNRDHDAIVNLVGNYAYDLLDEVGGAVIRLSKDLSPVEKKACDSPRGAGSPSPGR